MLRSIFAVCRGRLAVSFQGGSILEVDPADSSGNPSVICLRAEGAQSEPADLCYSADGTLLALATEDKRIIIWRVQGGEKNGENGNDVLLGSREIPKKPTRIRFARAGETEVVLASDRCGDVYAAPLPNPSEGLTHLLGHTSMTITTMEVLGGGGLLATGDRVEHIRVSEFPRTTVIHRYLLGHTDFVSALATVPGQESLLLSGGADGMIGLWDVTSGERLSWIGVKSACLDLAEDEGNQGQENAPNLSTTALLAPETDSIAGANSKSTDGSAGGGNGAWGREGGGGREAEQDGEGRGHGGEEGTPLSIACSPDGQRVVVAVSGLNGLLILRLTMQKGSLEIMEGGCTSLSPMARLQLPAAPLQAGFMGDEDIIVALPSPMSMQSYSCSIPTAGESTKLVLEEGGSGLAARACTAVNIEAERQGLSMALPPTEKEAAEAMEGGLRKRKGKTSHSGGRANWNNFSMRKEKRKRRGGSAS